MEKDRSIPEGDIVVSNYRASGAGGQKRDKTETAVRIHHLPTGIIVTASESRSRTINERRAMERLRERLAARNRKRKPRVRTRPGRAAKERRIREKKHRGEIKKTRGKIEE
ncbi:MAG: peptide chain release factor-like protein [Desulfuromonadales bacterium]